MQSRWIFFLSGEYLHTTYKYGRKGPPFAHLRLRVSIRIQKNTLTWSVSLQCLLIYIMHAYFVIEWDLQGLDLPPHFHWLNVLMLLELVFR